jgi:micrococcal nuclease
MKELLLASCIALGACQSTIQGQARVIDGDTIIINNTHIRLWGIDAPELREPGGQEARIALQNFIWAHTVYCEDQGTRTHKRVVAICYLAAGKMKLEINEYLVRRGYALDCAHYSGGKYRHLEPADVRSRLTNKPYC